MSTTYNKKSLISIGIIALIGLAIAYTVFVRVGNTSNKIIKIGFLVPDSGPAGIFGPSTRNSANMAINDINAAGGINGQKVELIFADAGLPPADVTQSALKLWKSDEVSAFVGMHDSGVRAAVQQKIGGIVPYVFTPVHAGGKCQAGVYITGPTPNQQLETSIPYITKAENVKNWYLIGHDYSWPRDTNVVAKQIIAATGGKVVGEEYLPMTTSEFDTSLANIKKSGADAVFQTIVGGGAVGFNIAFASFGLDSQALRLGTLIEENTLAAIGPGNTNRLYNSAGYFENIESQDAQDFAKKYYDTYGKDAARLNGLGEGAYEGLMLIAALANKAGSFDIKKLEAIAEGINFKSPRGAGKLEGRHVTQNIYLADGSSGTYKVIQKFPRVKSSEAC